MNFNELENIEKLAVSNETATNSYHQEILMEYFEKEKRKKKTKDNPFKYFYEDVISNRISFDFHNALGNQTYKNASEDAMACLNICDDFYKISSWSINGWLQNALKFTDNIVLHYLQEYCKELPKKFLNCGVEKARYVQISEKEGEISTAGFELKDLYDLRNDLEHRTIIHKDGRQELISPQRSKVRRTVVKLYPDALKRFLKTYKEVYPDFVNEN